MAEKIASHMGPELHGENGTQRARAWAMQTDRLLSTSQIYQPVSKTFSQSDPLGGQSSAIVYGKGQATLAMFETWLGEARFQADLSLPELLANLNDVQALTESGDLSVAEALGIAMQLIGHPQREVTESALTLISRMEALLEPAQRAAYAHF